MQEFPAFTPELHDQKCEIQIAAEPSSGLGNFRDFIRVNVQQIMTRVGSAPKLAQTLCLTGKNPSAQIYSWTRKGAHQNMPSREVIIRLARLSSEMFRTNLEETTWNWLKFYNSELSIEDVAAEIGSNESNVFFSKGQAARAMSGDWMWDMEHLDQAFVYELSHSITKLAFDQYIASCRSTKALFAWGVNGNSLSNIDIVDALAQRLLDPGNASIADDILEPSERLRTKWTSHESKTTISIILVFSVADSDARADEIQRLLRLRLCQLEMPQWMQGNRVTLYTHSTDAYWKGDVSVLLGGPYRYGSIEFFDKDMYHRICSCGITQMLQAPRIWASTSVTLTDHILQSILNEYQLIQECKESYTIALHQDVLQFM